LPADANSPPFTSSFSASGATVHRGHGILGRGHIVQEREQRLQRKRKECEQVLSGESRGQERVSCVGNGYEWQGKTPPLPLPRDLLIQASNAPEISACNAN
jgi:hypothetical protein